MVKLIHKIKTSIPEIIGMVAGGLAGFLYYLEVGCYTGTCPISSNPWISTIWGITVGYLAGGLFKKNK